MISHFDQEMRTLKEGHALRFDMLLRHGQILESTYLRSLLIDGMSIEEARARLTMVKGEMR